MQTKIDGSEELNVPIDRLRAFLSDTSNVAKCIPDSKDFHKIDNENFSISIEAGISVVHGTFKLNGTATMGDDSYLYKLSGKGLGSEVHISISVALSKLSDSATSIKWSTEASFTGIISGVSEPIIKNVTKQKVAEIMEKLKSELASA